MSRHKNNAIILTTIVGERGAQGFVGPAGQNCYTGTGDPNTLSLTLPDYSNDPAGTVRGVETLYYQDTVTGEVWIASMLNGVVLTGRNRDGSLRDVWNIDTSHNVKGDTGTTGAQSIDKIDINLGQNGALARYTSSVNDLEIAKIMFPGTNVAPDFSSIKVIAGIGNATGAIVLIKNYAEEIIAAGPVNNTEVGIVDIPINTSLPTDFEILTVHIYVIGAGSSPVNPLFQIGFLSIR